MKIETKYSPNDEVWLMSENVAICRNIRAIYAKCIDKDVYLEYSISGKATPFKEHDLFATRQELIDSL